MPYGITFDDTYASPVTGDTIDLGAYYAEHTMLVIPSGSFSSLTVAFEISHDNINFKSVPNGAYVYGGTNSHGVVHVNQVARYVRAAITEFSGTDVDLLVTIGSA